MIKYYVSKPKILFAGINPHPGSHERGVPFSNNKLFWYLLARAGLLHESEKELKDDAKLAKIYREKFNQIYGLGFINIIDRPTKDVTLLVKGEEVVGKKRMEKVIKEQKPAVVCFVGKISYQKFTGLKHFDFGWKDPIYDSRVYVMHFPLRGEASIRVQELQEVAKEAFKERYPSDLSDG